MCITETTSYRYGDKLYDTELKAVEGALQDLGSMLVKEHSANLAAGLIQHREKLEYLLNRYHVLSPPTPTATEVTSENSERGPEDRDQAIHDAFEELRGDQLLHAHGFFMQLGYTILEDFLAGATPKQKARMEELVGLRGEDD